MDSRELDALVAEKVMGSEWWIHIESDARFIAPGGEWVSHLHPKKASGKEPVDWDVINRACDLPRYSTDISAAWQVVEKLASPFQLEKDPDGEISCRIRLKTEWGPLAHADNPALAICLAALKALGVEQEKP